MTENSSPSHQSIDVILDFKPLDIDINKVGDLFKDKRWEILSRQLEGTSIVSGIIIPVSSDVGTWNLEIIETYGVETISSDLKLNVVDIKRDSNIRHECKVCINRGVLKFGPFFCPECRKLELENDRLCEEHSNFLENQFSAYCLEHIPRCQCSSTCNAIASFQCDQCHRFMGDHFKIIHPNDPLRLLCNTCYSINFELCVECKNEGRRRLGKSKCAFPIGDEFKPHGERCCTYRHAHQWQIWGPHWRGVVLCRIHNQRLNNASPKALLLMIVTAKAPAPFLVNRVRDAHRVRNMISYQIRTDFSWREMKRNLLELQYLVENSNYPGFVNDNIRVLLERIDEAEDEDPSIAQSLLSEIRNYYRPHLRYETPEQIILGVEIKRIFRKSDRPNQYRIGVRIGKSNQGRSMKGILIGGRGSLINPLKEYLKNRGFDINNIDLEE